MMDAEWEPPGGPGQLLTTELLQEYEERLRRHRVPIAAELRPGLSHDAIASLLAQIGLSAPAEAAAWWSWHDGARPGQQIAVGCQIFSLEDAVIGTLQAREIAAEAIRGHAGPDSWTEDYLWQSAWLKLLHGDGTDVALACDVDASAPSPVHWVDWWDEPERRHVPLAPSLGDLVHRWIAAIDAGAMYFAAEIGMWRVREEAPGPRLYRSGRW